MKFIFLRKLWHFLVFAQNIDNVCVYIIYSPHSQVCCTFLFNLYVTNGLAHYYRLDESTFILRGYRNDLSFIPFFNEIPLSKQNRPRSDAAFCGITSGALVFAYVPQKG